MKTTTCLAAALLCTVSPAADRVAYAPAEGSSSTKRFTISVSGELDDFSFSLEGEDMSGMMPEILVEMDSIATYVVTDEVLSVADGRPAKLRRTFDELSAETAINIDAAGQGEETDQEMSSELEGAAVLFNWDAEAEAYVASFDEDDEALDSALLDSLEEDMSLRALLPTDEVEEGDSWEIQAADLMAVGMPGGNLSLMPDDAGDVDMAEFEDMFSDLTGMLEERMPDWTSGGATATYAGTREVDGVTLAVITIDAEVSIDADLTELMAEAVDRVISEIDEELPDDLEIDFSAASLGMTISGSGELLWDTATGRVHAFSFQGDQEIAFDLEVDVAGEGESASVAASLEASGSYEYTVVTE